MNSSNTARTLRPTPVRAPLNRQRAVTAAISLADEAGIEALSMRKLAQALGVEAMSLYHHVASKHDILDGMIDTVFDEIELPDLDADWATAMRSRARSLRTALLRHRWAVGLMESRSSPGPATLRHHDAVLRCCRQAGFSVEMSAHAFSLLDSYIYGFVLQEINLPFNDGDDLGEVLESMVPEHFARDYPYFAELTGEYVLRPGYSYSDEFEFGLGLILDGLSGRRQAG
jgi:AcrR family transcriptional regulator